MTKGLVFGFIILLEIAAAFHALLYKRDPRTTWAWIVTCLLFPIGGPIIYFLFGINRVRTKAKRLEWNKAKEFQKAAQRVKKEQVDETLAPEDLSPHAQQLPKITEVLTGRPLVGENEIEILFNGEEAYPAMLRAINRAKEFIYLSTYIFDSDRIGRTFLTSLEMAHKRGVDVKIIVDGVGELYSFPLISWFFKKSNLPFMRFIPLKLYPPSPFVNLRNHRKIMIIDGKQAFTGGMNIGGRHLAMIHKKRGKQVQDIHFSLRGPVVNQLEEVFLDDWAFCSKNYDLHLSHSEPSPGDAFCRTITVGPDQDLNKLNMIIVASVSMARERVCIMTPYFLPTRELISALQTAALRKVSVEVILPAKNNLPFVHWATQNMLWELLEFGVKIYYQPPPFAHSKLFMVDHFYSLIGSANMDPRSLRLNFEAVVEVYDSKFALELIKHFDQVKAKSKEITLQEVDSRSLLVRTRDSLCWLFSPYL